jgi:aromatic-amino-acid transaminase
MSFSGLSLLEPDPLLSLTGRFLADPRPQKIDLGVGVYRDAEGRTPVFHAVKEAERHLAEVQETKAYLGSDGNRPFVDELSRVALGIGRELAGLQTNGGTGALYLAAELLARSAPQRTLWTTLPTWPNHGPIFKFAGLQVRGIPLKLDGPQEARFADFFTALEGAKSGDAVLLQGCCHNPTGHDLSPAEWDLAAKLVASKGLIAIVDIAYQGFAAGWVDDLAGVRRLADAVPELMIAYSCDKNFGLYRERVGALYAAGASAAETRAMHGHLTAYARSAYSMPPDHGAEVARLVMADAELSANWQAELTGMRLRIREVRTLLAAWGRVGNCDLAPLASGRGMFSMLPLSSAAIARLQHDHGIYMAPSGRINVAGLNAGNVAAFVDALQDVQRQVA